MHDKNAFITLTYEEMPLLGSLYKPHFQDFIKRLRYYKGEFRYYMCGEYGEENKRPHYHACLFGIDFKDRKLWTVRDGVRLYISEQLSSIWGKGFVTVGDVTFDSAAYCARYIMKKALGRTARPDAIPIPEYTDMSRNGGIGKSYYEKFKADIYPQDTMYMKKGEKHVDIGPPKFYDSLYEVDEPKKMAIIKRERAKRGFEAQWNRVEDRLKVRQKVKRAQTSKLVRDL